MCAVAARYPLPPAAAAAPGSSGARSGTGQFWEALSAGANLPVSVPISRWDIDGVYSPEAAAKKMCVHSECILYGVAHRPYDTLCIAARSLHDIQMMDVSGASCCMLSPQFKALPMKAFLRTMSTCCDACRKFCLCPAHLAEMLPMRAAASLRNGRASWQVCAFRVLCGGRGGL